MFVLLLSLDTAEGAGRLRRARVIARSDFPPTWLNEALESFIATDFLSCENSLYGDESEKN